MISIVAALARNRAIGRGNALPWHLPEDLRRFKALTTGHALVMGRKTYESIGRPLPKRTTIVVTRRALEAPPNVLVARSIEEALRLAGEGEVFIAGGAEIFAQTIPIADRMYLTLLDADIEGDTFFPEYDEAAWTVVEREENPPEGERAFGFAYVTLDRKRK